MSQLIRFARVCLNVDDFNNRYLFLTAKLLKQGYRYHKIRKAFSKFYLRHSELIVKYNIGLKTLLQQGISEPLFYGDLRGSVKNNWELVNIFLLGQAVLAETLYTYRMKLRASLHIEFDVLSSSMRCC